MPNSSTRKKTSSGCTTRLQEIRVRKKIRKSLFGSIKIYESKQYLIKLPRELGKELEWSKGDLLSLEVLKRAGEKTLRIRREKKGKI